MFGLTKPNGAPSGAFFHFRSTYHDFRSISILYLHIQHFVVHLNQETKQKQNVMENENKIEQMNTYQVVYSDGVRVLDYVYASNLNDAKKIAAENAKTKNYGTAYYKVARCYNGGVRGSSNETHWH